MSAGRTPADAAGRPWQGGISRGESAGWNQQGGITAPPGRGHREVDVAAVEIVLADAAENLYPARMQMAISLGWHIVFSCLGVAFPAMVMFAEWRAHKTGDGALHELAHTWAKAMGVLFAAGAVAG